MRTRKRRGANSRHSNSRSEDAAIIRVALDLGASDARFINPDQVVVREWVRLKCQYGCPEYSKRLTCPPSTPTIEQVKSMLLEYEKILLVKFEQPSISVDARDESFMKEFNSRQNAVNNISLMIEKQLMLKGYFKSFALEPGICKRCAECTNQLGKCRHPMEARPSPESLAIDMFSTVRNAGWSIDVKTDVYQNWTNYALILVE